MTRAFLDKQLKRLVGLKFAPLKTDTHWEALQDLPEALLKAAVGAAQREEDAFPSPASLRAIADRLRPQVLRVPAPQDREWKDYCDACHDTGWRSWRCGDDPRTPWLDVRDCGRTFEHGPHEWVAACPCAEGNPAIQRKREQAAQYAARRTPTKRGE